MDGIACWVNKLSNPTRQSDCLLRPLLFINVFSNVDVGDREHGTNKKASWCDGVVVGGGRAAVRKGLGLSECGGGWLSRRPRPHTERLARRSRRGATWHPSTQRGIVNRRPSSVCGLGAFGRGC